ncbi:glycosyltransferase [Desulfobulbus sp. F3]|nr:glycosyltransferase [Desulfobulbus sp. F3]
MENIKNSLSIVIITKNEGRNIAKCIESVIEATDHFHNREILLVDSLSSDNTIDISVKYQIKIIQLDSDFFISPAAGRFIGSKYTIGEYIYFLDGDMQLDKEWFNLSMPILENNPIIAGIAGICQDIIFEDNFNKIRHDNPDRYNVGKYIHKPKHLGGSVLYRRSALDNAGSFNPYLANEEELELGFRLSAAGYELWRIPVPMVVHYTIYYSNKNPSGLTARQIRRDIVSGRYVSLGKVLLLLSKNPFLADYIFLYWRSFVFIAVYLAGMLSIIIDFKYFILWLTIFVGLLGIRTLIKKSFLDTILYIADHSFSAYGFLVGFLQKKQQIAKYRPKLKFIKK